MAALLARPLALLASSVALEARAFSSMADRSIPAEESAWLGKGLGLGLGLGLALARHVFGLEVHVRHALLRVRVRVKEFGLGLEG